jgi:hypothetical protein
MTSHIQPGRVFACCDPRGGPSVRIVRYQPGWNRADVVDATTGKRPRRILARDLHTSGLTKSGTPRRTGYRLVQDEEQQP